MAKIFIKTVKTRSWIVQIWNAYEGNSLNRGEGMVTNGNNETWEIAFLLANQQQKSEKMDFVKDLRKVVFLFHLHLFKIIIIITNQSKIKEKKERMRKLQKRFQTQITKYLKKILRQNWKYGLPKNDKSTKRYITCLPKINKKAEKKTEKEKKSTNKKSVQCQRWSIQLRAVIL